MNQEKIIKAIIEKKEKLNEVKLIFKQIKSDIKDLEDELYDQ